MTNYIRILLTGGAAIALAACEHATTTTKEAEAAATEPMVMADVNGPLLLNLYLTIPQGQTSLGFYSTQSGVTCQPNGKNCVGYGVYGGDISLSNWVGPVNINMSFGVGAENYEFYPDPHDSLAVGPASEGPPPSREWNAEFINLTVSADQRTLSFMDRNDPGSGAFEYTLTVVDKTTGQPVVIDPKITNKGDN